MNGGIRRLVSADLLIEVANGGDQKFLTSTRRVEDQLHGMILLHRLTKTELDECKNEAKRHEYLRSLKEIAANPIKARKFLLPLLIEGLRRSEMLA